jgi:hypothetical protein
MADIGGGGFAMHPTSLSRFSTTELARHCATRAGGWLAVIGGVVAAGAIGPHL